jgi:3-oxoadipate enol-lactonase
LHGWTASADLNWFPEFGPLSRRYNVVAIDHRGHGRGIRSRDRFRLADCADDAAAACAELGTDRVIAVGYSMGGPIAQLLWHRHPDLVQGLVFCATARNFRGKPAERLTFRALGGLSVLARGTPDSMRRRAALRVLAGRTGEGTYGDWALHEYRRGEPHTIIEAGAAIGRFSSHEWIHEIDVPTAVVVTELDQVVPPHRQRKLAEAIPGATVHPVAGDHICCVQDPGRFVPVLLDACADVATRVADRT